jgi:hypothetical protein
MPKRAETWLYPSGGGPAYFEPIEFVVHQQASMLIPKPATMWVPWLEPPEKLEAIIELGEHGRLVVHPAKHAERLSEALLSNIDADLVSEGTAPLARSKLIAVGERFMRGKIDSNRNFYLSGRALRHLDLSSGQTANIMFVAVAGTFEIWTFPFYESIRIKLAATIHASCTDLRIS